MIETWTRVTTEDDLFDVAESYEEVMSLLEEKPEFLQLTGVAGYKIRIRPRCIVAFYESGRAHLIAIWEAQQEMDHLKKQTTSWADD